MTAPYWRMDHRGYWWQGKDSSPNREIIEGYTDLIQVCVQCVIKVNGKYQDGQGLWAVHGACCVKDDGDILDWGAVNH